MGDIDAILKSENETEFNYIEEIRDLRAELEEMDNLNRELNEEITAKNEELEQCNNRIAILESSNRRMSVPQLPSPLVQSDDDEEVLDREGSENKMSMHMA